MVATRNMKPKATQSSKAAPVKSVAPSVRRKITPEARLREAYRRLETDSEYAFHMKRIGCRYSPQTPIATPKVKPLHERLNRIEKVERFVASLAAGIIPDPDALQYVGASLGAYLASVNRTPISLDAAFGITTVQKAGHPLKRRQELGADEEYLRKMAFWRGNNQEGSIKDAAAAIYDQPTKTPTQKQMKHDFILRMTQYYTERGWGELEKGLDGGRLCESDQKITGVFNLQKSELKGIK